MFVVQRKVGESIAIDDSIQMTVVKITGNAVKIGFEAPKDVRIKRAEDNRNHLNAENNIDNNKENQEKVCVEVVESGEHPA